MKKETRQDALLNLFIDIGGEGSTTLIYDTVKRYFHSGKSKFGFIKRDFIVKDQGRDRFEKQVRSAFQPLKKNGHLKKQKPGTWKITGKGRRYIGQRFVETINPDEIEQNKIVTELIKQKKTKKEIFEELRSFKGAKTEKTSFYYKGYKRDNYTIALIKKLRGCKCQICGTYILKKNGNRYIEAAHIKPKYMGGKETLDNILILCPNHHKEFDHGDRTKPKKNKDVIIFTLNRKRFKIFFKKY